MTGRPASRPVPRVLRLLAPHRRRLAGAVAVAVLAEAAAVALMGSAGWLIARAAGHPEIAALTLAIVAVRALATGRGVLRYVDRLAGHDAVLSALAGLRATVFRALIPLAPAGIPAFRSGDLLTRLVDDVEAVADLLLRCLLPAVVCGGVGLAAVGVAAAMLPAAALALLAGLVLAALVVPWLVYRSARRTAGPGELRGALASSAVDLTAGAAELVAYGAAGEHVGRARAVVSAIAAAERAHAARGTAAEAVVLVVQGLTTVAVTVLAAHAAGAGHLDPVLVVVLSVLTLAVFETAGPLPAAARRFAEVRSSARRLADLLDTAPPVTEPDPRSATEADGWRPRGIVEVSGLRVRHPGAATAALDGVDLRLAPGRRTALAGVSGSGKSTLLAVLMRFLEPETGTVTLDGRDVRTLPGDTVRRAITGVTQDAHVFRADVRTNLLVGRPDADDHALRAVAARVRLLDWIESLPQGWSTVLGQGGATMSGGQRQRLLLARALLADPPVLLLDEPTEGLDAPTADAVLTDLLAATRDRATLLVTHRPSDLAAADDVVVLEQGRVVLRGAHHDLVGLPAYPG